MRKITAIIFSIAISCISLVGCSTTETAKKNLILDADKIPMVMVSSKEIAAGAIVTAADVHEVKESPAVIARIDQRRTVLRSKLETVGRIAKDVLPAGELVYAEQLSFPTRSQKVDNWLFSFQNDVLEKNVGKKITLKGELFQGEDKSFRILSYDSTGRILIVGELANGIELNNKCVLATGVLRRVPAVKKAPLLLYGFDAEKTKLTPSKW